MPNYSQSPLPSETLTPILETNLNDNNFEIYYATDNINVRKCPSLSCEIVGQYAINTRFDLSESNFPQDSPDWVWLQWIDEKTNETQTGYVSKSVLSKNTVVMKKNIIEQDTPQPSDKFSNIFTDRPAQPTVAPQQSDAIASALFWCNGKYFSSCPSGYSIYCPSTGAARCALNNPTNNQAIDSSAQQAIQQYVGNYLSNKYQEFNQLIKSYNDCMDKYAAIKEPLQTRQKDFEQERASIENKYGGYVNFYSLYLRQSGTTDDQKRWDVLNEEILSLGRQIVIQDEAEKQECTPYANMALGKAPYAGITMDSQIWKDQTGIVSPTQSFNDLKCTIIYHAGIVGVPNSGSYETRCADYSFCRTVTGADNSFSTTCSQN